MPTVYSSIVEADPVAVTGNFDAADVRNALIGNILPGLFERGDFAVSQRASGANMSVDIAQGRAFIDPRQATHQGAYLARRTNAAAYNTVLDGALAWPTSDPSNPRIDILGMQLYDPGAGDGSTSPGWKFAVITGTASASATHQLEAQLWPVIPAGFLPLAAVLRPAASTSITTAQITNLNPVGGGRASTSYTPAAETTSSSAYTRLATPDVLLMYVPALPARVRVHMQGQWKIAAASGNQAIAFHVDGVRIPIRNMSANLNMGADGVLMLIGTGFTRFITRPGSGVYFASVANSSGDVSDAPTAGLINDEATGQSVEIDNLSPGWHVIEARYKTSASTLTVQKRRLTAEIVG